MSEQVQSSLAGEVEALTPQQRERLRVDRLTPSHQAEVRKEHEARLEAERKATWPDPRAALRSFHAALAEAKAEIIRKHEVLDRAKQPVRPKVLLHGILQDDGPAAALTARHSSPTL